MAECFISIADFPEKKGALCCAWHDCAAAEQACAEAVGRSITNALLPVSLLTEANIKQFSILKQSHFSTDLRVSTPCPAFWGCSYLLLFHWRYRTLLPPAEKGQDLLDIPAKCPSVNLWMPAVSLESCCGSHIVLMIYICMEVINVQVLSSCHSFPPNQCQSSMVWHWRWVWFLIWTWILENWCVWLVWELTTGFLPPKMVKGSILLSLLISLGFSPILILIK